MINDTNRMKVAREAVKHIYIARMMMRMVCHSTGCSKCPFHNDDGLFGANACFYAFLDDIKAKFHKLEDMLITMNDQPKHAKPIKEAGND